MGLNKKLIRKHFRDSCYKRDQYRCAMCGLQSDPLKAEQILDAHHITLRTDMPNGGYVAENGISLCAECHKKAEQFHESGIAYPGYSVEELYIVINSSYEKAVKASQLLKI
jgi:predicted restriction endonuclease